MAQSPDAATIKRYKDLLVHYSPADGQMTKAMATPHAREWLQADKLVDQSVTNLEALQQELRDTGVGWMEGFAQMNADELDTLWEHADKGFRAYEVCQLSSGIEMFANPSSTTTSMEKKKMSVKQCAMLRRQTGTHS